MIFSHVLYQLSYLGKLCIFNGLAVHFGICRSGRPQILPRLARSCEHPPDCGVGSAWLEGVLAAVEPGIRVTAEGHTYRRRLNQAQKWLAALRTPILAGAVTIAR